MIFFFSYQRRVEARSGSRPLGPSSIVDSRPVARQCLVLTAIPFRPESWDLRLLLRLQGGGWQFLLLVPLWVNYFCL